MNIKSLSRNAAPLIVIGLLLIGVAVWRLANPARQEKQSTDNTPANVISPTSRCGDGICQDVACLSTDCPKPESIESCPTDCLDGSGSNKNAVPPSGLNFTLQRQTAIERKSCPVEEANITPADAVKIAEQRGLSPGRQALDVRLFRSDPPLEQCVWSVRNYDGENYGIEFLIIDATQEILEKKEWRES